MSTTKTLDAPTTTSPEPTDAEISERCRAMRSIIAMGKAMLADVRKVVRTSATPQQVIDWIDEQTEYLHTEECRYYLAANKGKHKWE